MRRKDNGSLVVIKKLKLPMDAMPTDEKTEAENEVAILKLLSGHPNVIGFRES